MEKLKQYATENNQKYRQSNAFDKKYIDGIKDGALRRETKEILKQYQKKIRGNKINIALGVASIPLALIGSFIASTLYATKLQVDGSKIARFQAREFLKDPKAFVEYTPEQIQQAKEYITAHPELLKQKEKNKDKKLKNGFFSSITNLFKDRKAYKAAKAQDTDESKMVMRELTPKEIEQAQRDRDVIQRTIRLINNEAEKNSENMEVAAGVLIGGTPFLGAAVGGAISFIVNKLGLIDKNVEKYVNQIGSEHTKELFKKVKSSKKGSVLIHTPVWAKFTDSMSDDIQGLIKEAPEAMKKSGKEGFKQWVKGGLNIALSHKWGSGIVMGVTGAFFTGIAGMILGLKLQKSAARAGRFTAKRELEENPMNFIGHTEEEYNSVQDIKSNKKEESKFKQYALFIPRVIKQYYAYEKYRKHEFKEEQALRKELQKMEVSERQMKDAKNLQRKLFNTFEKVDDNSQVYSESMEAATTIAQPFIAYGGMALLVSPIAVFIAGLLSGKITGASALNKITGLFSKSSKILDSTPFKNYLKGVETNISTNVQVQDITRKPIGTILEGVNIQNDSIFDMMCKSWKNLCKSTGDLRNIPEEEFNQIIRTYESALDKGVDLANTFGVELPKSAKDNLKKLFKKLRMDSSIDKNTKIDILDMVLNPSKIKSMSDEQFNNAKKYVTNFSTDIIKFIAGEKNVKPVLDEIYGVLQKFDTNELKQLYLQADNKLKAIIPEKDIDNLLNKIQEIQLNSKNVDNVFDLVINKDNIVSVLEQVEKIKTKVNTVKDSKAGEMILAALENIPLTTIKDKKISIQAIRSATIKDVKNLIPENVRNCKTVINNFKTKIEGMSDDAVKEFMIQKNFSSMDKKTLLQVLNKVEKIIDNIPKQEIQRIMDTIVKEFNEHPDEFVKLVSSGKIATLFITPGLTKAIAAAGITWTAFSLGVTYAFQAWLADMQLKAGRLGVMKSLESLNDPRYYANIEPVQE